MTVPGRPPQIHELKTAPGPFEDVWRHRKHAEFRKDDRGFAVLDRLILREYAQSDRVDQPEGYYTGRWIAATVTHIVSGEWGIPDGYAMLSLATQRSCHDPILGDDPWEVFKRYDDMRRGVSG